MPKTSSFSELEDRARANNLGWDDDIAVMKKAMDDALELAELRKRRGVAQVQLSERLAISQGNVSDLEHRRDLYLSTLRSYVEALGGHFEVAVVFDDERVVVDA